MHVPATERHAGIHRGYPGHVTADNFPLSGGPGAAREIGAGGVRAVRGRCHRGREGTVVLVDGTLTPHWSYEEHQELWNGKHKTTGFNAQLIALLDGTAVWISGPLPGKTYDAKAFKETGAADILKEAGGGFGDKGYQGTDLITPKKKPKGGELTLSDKEYNSQISSFRAPVERLVAHFKNWKIFHTDYRRPHAIYNDAFDAARALFFFSITWGLNNALGSESGSDETPAWCRRRSANALVNVSSKVITAPLKMATTGVPLASITAAMEAVIL
jgi:hypothetical protein